MDDELELIVSLFTPASDLASGAVGERFEAVFARRGNDSLYGFAPGTTQDQQVDILFGDIFDNTEAEFEIIRNIQANQQGGNPLLILERNIPSLGRDRHVLGDTTSTYYLGDPATLTSSNLLGTNEFAVIYDFDPAQDEIQLNGSAQDYQLIEVNNLQVEGVSAPFSGEAIFSLRQGTPDLVGYVVSRPEVDLSLTADYFEYVGNRAPKRPEQRRVEQLGSRGLDFGLASETDASGNVYIAGSTTGALQSGNQVGLSDNWVAKYDSSGNQVFLRQFGTTANDSVSDVATDSAGNFYLSGLTQGSLFGARQSSEQDAWIAKYDSGGNLIWGRQFGANLNGAFSNGAFGLDTDAQGNVYASGLGIKNNDRQDIFPFAVQDDAWVTKFDTNGNQQWFTQIGSFFFDEAYDVAVDANGNTYAVGWTQGLVRESDPSRQLSKYDAWIAKLNPSGQVEWTQQLGSPDQGLEFAWGVDTDSQGNAYVTGWTTSGTGTSDPSRSYDIWLSKFRPDSTQEWTRQFGSAGDDGSFQSDLKIDSQDGIYLSGYTGDRISGRGQNRGRNDAFVAKFDTSGNNQWIQQWGSSGTDYATGLSIDRGASRVSVTGFTDGPLGSTNTEATDAWFAQLDARRGRLQRVTGSARGRLVGNEPTTMPNMGANITLDENLPAGDNRISLPGTVDPRSVNNQLAGIFDSNRPNGFPRALAGAVSDDFSNFLPSTPAPAPAPTEALVA
jgi:hypothetical protein